MGMYSVVMGLGTIIGPLLGGYLLDRYGLASLFYVGVLILVLALSLAVFIRGAGFRTSASRTNR
jgi:predicted MFS family arabinose efflux permease